MFSAYLLDPEHGWQCRSRLSLTEAVQLAKDFRDDWAGSAVAVVQDGVDPLPYLDLATTLRDHRIVDAARLRVVETDFYGHCDTCGTPCDANGCIRDRTHLAALA